MSQNNTGKLYVVVDQDDVTEYHFSPQDDLLALTNIPGGNVGTVVFLPDDPNAGDAYTVVDADGSSSSTHPILVEATQDILGGGTYEIDVSRSSATFLWDVGAQTWVVTSSAQPFATPSVLATPPAAQSGPGGTVTTGNVAYESASGIVRVTAQMTAITSAAGTSVSFQLTVDGAPVGKPVVVGSSTDAGHNVGATLVWIEQPSVGSHNYACVGTATGGTATLDVNACVVILEDTNAVPT